MKSNTKILQFCAGIESQFDTVLFKTKIDPATGQVYDDSAKAEMSPGNVAANAAAVGAVGGGYLGHRAIVNGYGGSEAGVGQAYRNAGRNLARGVTTSAQGAATAANAAISKGIQTAKSAVEGGTGAASRSLLRSTQKGIPTVKKLVRVGSHFLQGTGLSPLVKAGSMMRWSARDRLIALSQQMETLELGAK